MQPSPVVESPYPCLHLGVLFLVLLAVFFSVELFSRDRSELPAGAVVALAVMTPFYVGVFYVGPAILLCGTLFWLFPFGSVAGSMDCAKFDAVLRTALGLAALDTLAIRIALRSHRPKVGSQILLGLVGIPIVSLIVLAVTAALSALVVAWNELEPVAAGTWAELFQLPRYLPGKAWNIVISAALLIVGSLLVPVVADVHRSVGEDF